MAADDILEPAGAAATMARCDGAAWPIAVAFLMLGALLRYGAYALITPHADPAGFAQAMCVWDCYWYGDIARNGYQPYPEVLNFGGPAGIANWAFFPLYPLLLRAMAAVVPASPGVLGAILSPLFAFLAVVAARPLLTGRRAYLLFAALVLAGPFSFYFATAYSEALFLLLTVLGFRALGRANFLGAGVWGALLSATRTVGVLFVFSMLLAVAGALRWKPRAFFGRPDIVLGLALAPLGLFAFMVLLHAVTGDALGFMHIQRAWDRQSGNPLAFLYTSIVSPTGQVRDAPLLGLAALAGLGLSGVLAWWRRWPEALFCLLCIALALTQGVESMVRFIAALAPVGMALSELLARSRWLAWTAIALFLVLDVLFTQGWLAQRGALM